MAREPSGGGTLTQSHADADAPSAILVPLTTTPVVHSTGSPAASTSLVPGARIVSSPASTVRLFTPEGTPVIVALSFPSLTRFPFPASCATVRLGPAGTRVAVTLSPASTCTGKAASIVTAPASMRIVPVKSAGGVVAWV